ncbi:hypothetical protein DL770_009961 [Monosporascus sp. CRB-9-2]|nr:hypothetical protein DL770_009961 [Monosporascus sp. CRB-9-2]
MANQVSHGPNGIADATGKTDILAIALDVVRQTKDITDYLRANGLASPTFAADTAEVPENSEYLALRIGLKASLEDLGRLVNGPKQQLRALCCQGYDLAAFQIAFEFDLFTLVPAQQEISLSDLAQKAGLDVDRVSRIVRLMITHRFFQERKPGFISHTASSYVLFRDEDLRSMVAYSLDENLKAATASADCLRASPHESDATHSPFYTQHGIPAYSYYDQDPRRANRFAKAMAGAEKMGHHINRDFFPWESLKGTVVDVGGGSGHISMALARRFPELDFVVQDDVIKMLDQGKALLEDDLQGRVSFMQHSFFEPQPLKDVAAFLLRQCTHNWCDRDVIAMLKGIVPGLQNSKPGTPLLINDIIMPEAGTCPRLVERELRQIDMIMFVAFGAKQRTEAEFRYLLKQADPRYEVRKVHAEGSQGILEVFLNY